MEKIEEHPDNETLRSIHQTLLASLESHYSEIVKFLAILIPSLTGYGIALYQYSTPHTDNWAPPFVAITVIAILVLTWGAWLGLAMSYRFRYLVIALNRIEAYLHVEKLLPNTFQPKQILKFKDRIMLRIAPEILRVHVVIFLFVIILITLISALILDSIFCFFVPLFGGVMIIMLIVLGGVVYPEKYNKLLRTDNK